jgi:dipeptidyl aminopeptidase/acylaminoacyl peptidase
VSCADEVRVWDWRRGEETRRFARSDVGHHGFDLAPDGTTLLLPSGQLWDVAMGKQTGSVPNFKGWFQFKAVFAPDGKRLTQPQGATAIVTEVRTGREICRFAGHEPVKEEPDFLQGQRRVECVAFSPDGRRAASGGAEGLAFVWDAATGKTLRRLQGHTNPIVAVAFSPDGRTVATASGDWMKKYDDQTVRLWEVTTGKERRRFAGHQAQVWSIVFSRDGSTLVSGSEDGTALVWDAVGVGKPQAATAAHAEALWRVLADADAVAAYEAVCTLAARKEVAFLADHLRPVAAADPALLGRLVADLDSEVFAKRQEAERELGKLEELAEPALRKAAADSASAEVRRRAETLLTKLETAVPAAGTVQALRAVEVLERIGTPEARQLLQTLAAGAPEALPTREAKGALERLRSR